MTLKVAFVSRDPAIRLAGARALEQAPVEWAIALVDEAPLDADVVVCGPDAADCRGVSFDPATPDVVLRAIAAAARRATVVAVAGAGGGCGVTTVALHMARSYKSCFLECHPRAGAAERMGLDRTAVRTWSADGALEETAARAALPMRGGFRALFAPPSPSNLDDVVRSTTARFATVVLDVPWGDEVPSISDVLVLVMPPTRPGVVRAVALLEGLPTPVPRAVVANRQGPGGEISRRELQLLLGDGIAGELPCSAALRDAEDDAALLASRSRWARRLDVIAAAVLDSSRPGGHVT